MKKLFVLLLAFVVVGGIFAQATVNGYVRTTMTYSEGSFAYADRLRLNLGFTSEDKTVKMFARLQGDSAAAWAGASYLWGSLSLLDGKAKITAGKLGNYDYNLGCGISEYKLGNVANDGYALDSVKGVLLQVYPVEGLDIGVAVLPDGTEFHTGMLGINAKYNLKDIGDVIFESTLNDDFAKSRLSASFSFTGVENLTASAGFKGLETMSGFAIIDFAMGDLSIEAVPEYDITNSALYVEGYLSYKMGNASFNVIGAYDQAGGTLGAAATKASYALNTKTGAIDMTAAKAAAPSTYFFGVEAIYAVGKAKLLTGFYYDEVKKWSVPVEVKLSF
jgi:hypothetical protein